MEKRVFVIVKEINMDGMLSPETSVEVFEDKGKALLRKYELQNLAREDFEDFEKNEIEEEETRISFSIYQKGWYLTNHINITLTEQKVL